MHAKPLGRTLALSLMVAAPVLWSTAGVVTRHIQGATAFEMVFWRSLFCAFFVTLTLLILNKTNPWQAARAAGWPGVFSGLMWGVMFTAFVVALSLTSTANTLVVMSIGPLLTALLARMLLSDLVPVRTWLASAAAIAGIAWMFGAGFSSHRHNMESTRSAVVYVYIWLICVSFTHRLFIH